MSDLCVVTGGGGFIGSHLVRGLLERGERVRVLDNFSTGSRHNLADVLDRIEIVEGDVRSLETCREAVLGAAYVFHQAALPSVPRSVDDPISSHAVNATGTLNLLVASRDARVKRVVYASSSSVYGPVPKTPREEVDRPGPVSPYAVAKLCGEHYCGAFYSSYGLETVALRYFNVFGPRQGWDSAYSAVIPRFILALNSAQRPKIFGDGKQIRDFTYVDNVVHANLLALSASAAPGRVYNIAAGQPTSVAQLLAALAEASGIRALPEFCPSRVGDVRDSLASLARAQDELGYAPLVSLDRGLALTLEWAARYASEGGQHANGKAQ